MKHGCSRAKPPSTSAARVLASTSPTPSRRRRASALCHSSFGTRADSPARASLVHRGCARACASPALPPTPAPPLALRTALAAPRAPHAAMATHAAAARASLRRFARGGRRRAGRRAIPAAGPSRGGAMRRGPGVWRGAPAAPPPAACRAPRSSRAASTPAPGRERARANAQKINPLHEPKIPTLTSPRGGRETAPGAPRRSRQFCPGARKLPCKSVL